MTKPTPISDLRLPHPDQARIDALSAQLLRESVPSKAGVGSSRSAGRKSSARRRGRAPSDSTTGS